MDDLIVRRARVATGASGVLADDVRDVVFNGGRVAAIERDASGWEAYQVIDAEEDLLVPGLIDLHVHAWWGATHLGIDIDDHRIERGVTTAVDAGSAGSNTFRAFHRYVLTRNRTRTLAFLNISGLGQLDRDIGEAEDLRWCRVGAAVETAREFPDEIVGIKVRLSRSIAGDNDLAALDRALEAASELGLPVMVHIGGSAHPMDDILARLRRGDVVTHCYTALQPGILGTDGRVLDSAGSARERGVLFDVGHGRGSFTFAVAEACVEQGFLPSTISSDLHSLNVNGPVFDLPTTLSKILSLGVELPDVIAMATSAPAEAVGIGDRAGRLAVGAVGDAALLREERGSFTLEDAAGATRQVGRILRPIATIQRGAVVARAGRPVASR